MTGRRALLSVADKTGLVPFARGLADLGWTLVSTGGTARALSEAGLPVQSVESVTGFPEILGGRVKTLHPAVHGGILARREPAHLEELAGHGIAAIDLVAVNLYPFEATIARPGVQLAEAVEEIDIGGVTLLRAAAKNHEGVIVLSDPAQYGEVLQALRAAGEVPLELRRRLAVAAFERTARYDAAIAGYLAQVFAGRESPFLPTWMLQVHKHEDLRYGENPQQRAALYLQPGVPGPLGGELLQGKALSYNNILDMDAAWTLANDFSEPAAVIVKHNNPCGAATAEALDQAMAAALASDPVSAYGSVIAVNRPLDGASLRALGDLFVEVFVAPGYSAEALARLARRPNVRLLQAPPPASLPETWEVRSVHGGLLLQDRDRLGDVEWRVVSRRAPTERERRALDFSWRVCARVKSNAIVLAQDTATVGVGAGQMSRVDSVYLAARKAGERARGSAMASDAFFPFPDGIEAAAEAGVTAVIQPGGSVRDEAVIEAADRAGMAMVFTGVRHFRH
ncbi:MAG: bifunctional phosphoribosylaminoimidazolecarboxamide formyltransferase/IMP cyclohydrolase [Anaerolineae bacterium]|nr:bifunctional phosphoribosylaminoimidazolecarboxamide formyltransferase/IMP cyclohydrolase [Anaerolineae bacterium]